MLLVVLDVELVVLDVELVLEVVVTSGCERPAHAEGMPTPRIKIRLRTTRRGRFILVACPIHPENYGFHRSIGL